MIQVLGRTESWPTLADAIAAAVEGDTLRLPRKRTSLLPRSGDVGVGGIALCEAAEGDRAGKARRSRPSSR